jgi:predicted dienelactone hydrolase/Mor family transcriptional regulator
MFQDPNRGNRQIETEIYYPATIAGEDTPAAVGEYPVIVFGHGFVMAWSAYENLWEEFVSRGYIMAFPRTEGNAFSTDHQEFGWDLQFLVTAMQQEGGDPTSLLYQAVASETALMGHSMGGGAAFLAADSLVNNGNTNLKTLIGLAPAESNSNGVSSIASANQVSLPSLILSGQQDGVTPPANHHIPMYNNLASDCKTIINVIGGAHCYFANSNFQCDFGEGTSSNGISISRQEQHQVTFDFVNLWLDYTLKADCNNFTTFNDSLAVSPRINFDQVCNGPMVFESSETATICQGTSYTFPDGTTSSTASTHTSTLSTVGGCDSIVETTLQVNNSYSIVESATICQGNTYTFPDGTTASSATNHTSIFNTISGCDSTIQTTLQINDSYSLTETATICQGSTFTFPDGTTASAATTHMSNLTTINGCDSIIQTTLQMNNSYNATETAAICQGNTYTFPDGTTASSATNHTSVFNTISGCDSTIQTTLQINDTYNMAETATICQGSTFTFPDGTTASSTTTHTSNLSTIEGCDSIIETTLQVTNSFNLSETRTICLGDSYIFPDGTVSSVDTTHTSSLISVGGCDSIIETTLNITVIDTSITSGTFNLASNQTGATYQWINCEDNTPINGETNSTFEPQESGSYTVEITLDGCISNSNCLQFQVAGLGKETTDQIFKMYPNPSTGNFAIESSSNYNIVIFDATGSIIHETHIISGENKINLSLNPGIYFWKASNTQNKIQTGKLVVR